MLCKVLTCSSFVYLLKTYTVCETVLIRSLVLIHDIACDILWKIAGNECFVFVCVVATVAFVDMSVVSSAKYEIK